MDVFLVEICLIFEKIFYSPSVIDLGWMKFTKDIEISKTNPASGMEPQFMNGAQV